MQKSYYWYFVILFLVPKLIRYKYNINRFMITINLRKDIDVRAYHNVKCGTEFRNAELTMFYLQSV